jgi:hypothetical protein
MQRTIKESILRNLDDEVLRDFGDLFLRVAIDLRAHYGPGPHLRLKLLHWELMDALNDLWVESAVKEHYIVSCEGKDKTMYSLRQNRLTYQEARAALGLSL